MSRFTMFLYVEGQLIQYFCFECTQSKSTMYTIKIHLPSLTVCMLLESQRWRSYLHKQYVDNILGKMLTGLKNVDKMGLNPRAYPPRVQPQKNHKFNTCSYLCLFKMGKRKKKVKEKDG